MPARNDFPGLSQGGFSPIQRPQLQAPAQMQRPQMQRPNYMGMRQQQRRLQFPRPRTSIGYNPNTNFRLNFR